ncbi:MAG: hypothetical protein K6T91_10970 [Firmicutes bacterium]|nr:hypothetical protein [Bacillota bacterium]
MSSQDAVKQAKDRDCRIIEQLRNLAKRGHKMPWVREDGIATFQKLILKELVKKTKVPGSINCRDELEKEFGIDLIKIKIAAAGTLAKNEALGPHNFCKVSVKALEQEILSNLQKDVGWAQRLLARYVVCTLKDRGCHAETVNDLLTVTYKAEEALPVKQPADRIIFLLSIIKAWKSGLLCGVIEECLTMQEKFVGRISPVCSNYADTIDRISCTYFNLKGIKSRLSSLGRDIQDAELRGSVNQVQAMVAEIMSTIRKSTPIYDKEFDNEAEPDTENGSGASIEAA